MMKRREEKVTVGERNSMHGSQGEENVEAAERRIPKIWRERWVGKPLKSLEGNMEQ